MFTLSRVTVLRPLWGRVGANCICRVRNIFRGKAIIIRLVINLARPATICIGDRLYWTLRIIRFNLTDNLLVKDLVTMLKFRLNRVLLLLKFLLSLH